jgi:hypothetical protein
MLDTRYRGTRGLLRTIYFSDPSPLRALVLGTLEAEGVVGEGRRKSGVISTRHCEMVTTAAVRTVVSFQYDGMFTNWRSDERIECARVLFINLDTLDGAPVGVLQRRAVIGLNTVGIGLTREVLSSPPCHIYRRRRPGLK